MPRMYKKKLLVTYFIAYLLYALTAFGLFLIISYVWPRDVATVTKFETTAQQYKTGDTVYVTLETRRLTDAQVVNNIYLVCDQSQYYIKTLSMPAAKDEENEIKITFPLFVMPADVYPPGCKIVSDTVYEVNYLLGFTHKYLKTYTTNGFQVTSFPEQQ